MVGGESVVFGYWVRLRFGYYVVTGWLLFGYYMVTIWLLSDYYLLTMWLLSSSYLITICLLSGYYLLTMCILCGYYLHTIWLLSSYYPHYCLYKILKQCQIRLHDFRMSILLDGKTSKKRIPILLADMPK